MSLDCTLGVSARKRPQVRLSTLAGGRALSRRFRLDSWSAQSFDREQNRKNDQETTGRLFSPVLVALAQTRAEIQTY